MSFEMPGNPYAVEPDQWSVSSDGEATVTALLALAFEQRTANLIAYYALASQLDVGMPTQEALREMTDRMGMDDV